MAKYEVIDGKGIIPEWATEIEAEAFKGCKELKCVVIPQWVRKIGESAFSGCENLESIELPEWLEEIGNYAFSSCKNIKTIIHAYYKWQYSKRRQRKLCCLWCPFYPQPECMEKQN